MAMGITKGEKIGQLLIFGFDGTDLNQHAQDVIKSCAPGGVALTRRNFSDKAQIKTLIDQLQAFNKQYHPASPHCSLRWIRKAEQTSVWTRGLLRFRRIWRWAT